MLSQSDIAVIFAPDGVRVKGTMSPISKPQSVWHLVPHEMRGENLYPLNQLRMRWPDVYARAIAKYDDDPARKLVPQRVIPKLGCLWNDVVQCAGLHPHHLYQALTERGMNISPNLRFYQIPIDRLEGKPLAVYYSDPPEGREVGAALDDSEIDLLDVQAYREQSQLTARTLNWYDHLASVGKVFGLFVGVPHIMVQGSIDVRGVPVITWGEGCQGLCSQP